MSDSRLDENSVCAKVTAAQAYLNWHQYRRQNGDDYFNAEEVSCYDAALRVLRNYFGGGDSEPVPDKDE